MVSSNSDSTCFWVLSKITVTVILQISYENVYTFDGDVPYFIQLIGYTSNIFTDYM